MHIIGAILHLLVLALLTAPAISSLFFFLPPSLPNSNTDGRDDDINADEPKHRKNRAARRSFLCCCRYRLNGRRLTFSLLKGMAHPHPVPACFETSVQRD